MRESPATNAEHFGALDTTLINYGNVGRTAADVHQHRTNRGVGIIADDAFPLLGLLSQIAPVIIAGNTCVCLASQEFPYPAIVLGELLAVSDLPGGVVNILTGFRKELVPTFATHTHIRGLSAVVNAEEKKQLQLGAAESIKRVRARKPHDGVHWMGAKSQSVYEIRDFIEFKTTWHPIGS